MKDYGRESGARSVLNARRQRNVAKNDGVLS